MKEQNPIQAVKLISPDELLDKYDRLRNYMESTKRAVYRIPETVAFVKRKDETGKDETEIEYTDGRHELVKDGYNHLEDFLDFTQPFEVGVNPENRWLEYSQDPGVLEVWLKDFEKIIKETRGLGVDALKSQIDYAKQVYDLGQKYLDHLKQTKTSEEPGFEGGK